MKTRSGFVSNSSSTSFTVVLRQDVEGVNARVFDLVTQILGTKHGKLRRIPVGEERERLLDQQKILTRNQNFIQDQIIRLTEISKDLKTVALLDELWPILNDTGDLQYTRQKSKKSSNVVQDTLRRLDYREKENSRKLETVTNKLTLLAGVSDSNFLVQWEEDNMSQPLSDAVAFLVKEGVVTILEEVRT